MLATVWCEPRFRSAGLLGILSGKYVEKISICQLSEEVQIF